MGEEKIKVDGVSAFVDFFALRSSGNAKNSIKCIRISDENNAQGQKVTKRVYDTPNNELKEVDYLDGFQYAGGVLQFFPHAEGYVNVIESKSALTAYIFNYVYNYTDHLGNIRMSYTKDPLTNRLRILEENHYYPFGLKHSVYNSGKMKFKEDEENQGEARPVYVYKTDYQYKFGNKELQDELGLNLYDYGFRNYDPAVGRWFSVDLLSEENYEWSPYNYVVNNPVLRIDPNGLTDYTYNKKTGEVTQVGEKNDDPDRILRTNRKGEIKYDKKGEAKVAIDGIAQGILTDGMNFKEDNNTIAVNGEGQPTTEQVEDFVVKFSNHIGKEIAGYAMGQKGSEKVENMLIWNTKDNSFGESYSNTYKKDALIDRKYTNTAWDVKTKEEYQKLGVYAKYHYHTHPNVSERDIGRNPNTPSEGDLNHKTKTSGLLHYILNTNGKHPF